jgi:hypothetical protein
MMFATRLLPLLAALIAPLPCWPTVARSQTGRRSASLRPRMPARPNAAIGNRVELVTACGLSQGGVPGQNSALISTTLMSLWSRTHGFGGRQGKLAAQCSTVLIKYRSASANGGVVIALSGVGSAEAYATAKRRIWCSAVNSGLDAGPWWFSQCQIVHAAICRQSISAGWLANDRTMMVRRKPQEPINFRNPTGARMTRRLYLTALVGPD